MPLESVQITAALVDIFQSWVKWGMASLLHVEENGLKESIMGVVSLVEKITPSLWVNKTRLVDRRDKKGLSSESLTERSPSSQ